MQKHVAYPPAKRVEDMLRNEQCENLKGGQMCRDSDKQSQELHVSVCDEGLESYRDALIQGSVRGTPPRCLLELHLVRPLPEEPEVLAPVPPDIAARYLAQPLEHSIRASQHALVSVREAVMSADRVYQDEQRKAVPPVRLLQGADVISAALEQAVHNCREELLTAQPGGGRSSELLGRALPRDVDLNARGVRQRTLYQHTVRTHGPTLSYIEQITAVGAEVRTLDEVFERIIICDRSIGFIPDDRHERRTAALVVEHPGIIGFLVKVFEHAWERAEPVGASPAKQRPKVLTEATRHTVLRLMVDGYTDDAIASRLGMSPRTVANHIKKTAEVLGSRSRAQLAYLIAQAGLLEPQDEDAIPSAPAAKHDAPPSRQPASRGL